MHHACWRANTHLIRAHMPPPPINTHSVSLSHPAGQPFKCIAHEQRISIFSLPETDANVADARK
jgi:hypothetical protein